MLWTNYIFPEWSELCLSILSCVLTVFTILRFSDENHQFIKFKNVKTKRLFNLKGTYKIKTKTRHVNKLFDYINIPKSLLYIPAVISCIVIKKK